MDHSTTVTEPAGCWPCACEADLLNVVLQGHVAPCTRDVSDQGLTENVDFLLGEEILEAVLALAEPRSVHERVGGD